MWKHQLSRKNVKLGLMQRTPRVLSVQYARQATFVLKNQSYQLFALVVLTVKHLRHLANPVLPALIALKAHFNQSFVVAATMQGHRQPCVPHAPQAIFAHQTQRYQLYVPLAHSQSCNKAPVHSVLQVIFA